MDPLLAGMAHASTNTIGVEVVRPRHGSRLRPILRLTVHDFSSYQSATQPPDSNDLTAARSPSCRRPKMSSLPRILPGLIAVRVTQPMAGGNRARIRVPQPLVFCKGVGYRRSETRVKLTQRTKSSTKPTLTACIPVKKPTSQRQKCRHVDGTPGYNYGSGHTGNATASSRNLPRPHRLIASSCRMAVTSPPSTPSDLRHIPGLHQTKKATDAHYLWMGRHATIGGSLSTSPPTTSPPTSQNHGDGSSCLLPFVNAPHYRKIPERQFWKADQQATQLHWPCSSGTPPHSSITAPHPPTHDAAPGIHAAGSPS